MSLTPLASAGEPIDARGRDVTERRHVEYLEFLTVWKWLSDSLEAGQRYRDAEYAVESYTVHWATEARETGERLAQSRTHRLPRCNLVRHPQEYPQPPSDGQSYASTGLASSAFNPLVAANDPTTSDEYGFRRALTPVPGFVAETVARHLSGIYSREVRREPPPGPLGDKLALWWKDVDGSGTGVDDWMQETVAPLFLALGQLDLAFDHPQTPAGEVVGTQADVNRLGLDACVATYVLPENVVDWTLDRTRHYARAVVIERGDDASVWFREWDASGSTLYDCDGRKVSDDPHPYGCVPVVRCFDVRKPRCDHVGQSRYEGIAEMQRQYYNVDSELTLSNSLAAHASLSGPEDFCEAGSIQVGPGNVLPKKKISGQGGGYEGWEYVCPPNDAADKLRQKLADIRDAVDRAACLTKPAGARGSSGGTVSQSGVSKMLDEVTGNDLLSKLAKALRRVEIQAATMALTVLNDGPVDPALIEKLVVSYPTKFDLFTAADFAGLVADFQGLTAGADGDLEETTGQMLHTYVRLAMPGLDDSVYKTIDTEIDAFLAKKKAAASAMAEAVAGGGMAGGAAPTGAPAMTPVVAGMGGPEEELP